MTKATITFTMQQAIAFITEKLQDDFSSNFKFSVEIYDNCQIIPAESQKSLDNPWLIPDEDGWFTHDPGYTEACCPEYIQKDKLVKVKLRSRENPQHRLALDWCWQISGNRASDIVKWKYA